MWNSVFKFLKKNESQKMAKFEAAVNYAHRKLFCSLIIFKYYVLCYLAIPGSSIRGHSHDNIFDYGICKWPPDESRIFFCRKGCFIGGNKITSRRSSLPLGAICDLYFKTFFYVITILTLQRIRIYLIKFLI